MSQSLIDSDYWSLTQGCLHLRAGPGSTTWLSSCSACGSGLLIGSDFDIFPAMFSAIFSHSASFSERHVESNHVKSCLVEKRESTAVTEAKPANDPLENILYATSVGVQLPKQLQRVA